MSDWSSDVCSSDLFSGIPTNRCSAAQLRQAVRQPNSTSSQAERGQPTVLAKPANKVIPVMALRAWLPYSFTTVEKAASYKPMPMPAPISSQAMKNTEEPGDRSEEHTSELQSLMRNSYAVFCLKKKNYTTNK